MTAIDFNRWDKELAPPPVENALRLCDYLPEETQSFLTSSGLPAEVLTYTWQEEVTYEKASRWGKAAVQAGQVKEPAGSESFLLSAIKDEYDHDRAVRAAKTLGKQPFRRSAIEERIIRVVSSSGEQLPYALKEKPFEWTVDTPDEAVDATASVLEAERPDRLWLAEYVQEGRSRADLRAEAREGLINMASDLYAKYPELATPTAQPAESPTQRTWSEWRTNFIRKWDPIIYAEYGDWQVEVARWE